MQQYLKKGAIGLSCIVFIPAIPAFGQPGNEGWNSGDGWHHMMDFRGGDIYMWLLLIIIIGVVIYFLMNNSPSRQHFSSRQEETPLDILKRRYANGEITKEQFEDMKRDVV